MDENTSEGTQSLDYCLLHTTAYRSPWKQHSATNTDVRLRNGLPTPPLARAQTLPTSPTPLRQVYYGASQVLYGKSITSSGPIRLCDSNELCTKISQDALFRLVCAPHKERWIWCWDSWCLCSEPLGHKREMTITSSMNTFSNTGNISTLHQPTVTITTVTHTHWLPIVADPHHLPQIPLVLVWWHNILAGSTRTTYCKTLQNVLDIWTSFKVSTLLTILTANICVLYMSSQFCVAQLTKNEHVGMRVHILACAYVCLFLVSKLTNSHTLYQYSELLPLAFRHANFQ